MKAQHQEDISSIISEKNVLIKDKTNLKLQIAKQQTQADQLGLKIRTIEKEIQNKETLLHDQKKKFDTLVSAFTRNFFLRNWRILNSRRN